MAFFSKAGSILKQTVSRHINSEICGSNPSVFQMIRCMSSKLFVGGLSYNVDDTTLREAFNKYGEVVEARVIMDRDTGRSRGFAFVTYYNDEEASAAIQALDGQDLHGRVVRVNHATERAPRTGGYGGGGGDSYGGGGNYGSYGGGGGNYYGGGGGGGGYGGNFAQGGGGGGGNQSFGGGGSVGNYGSGDSGFNSSFGSSGYEESSGLGHGGDQFGTNENTKMGDASGGFGGEDVGASDDYANRRA